MTRRNSRKEDIVSVARSRAPPRPQRPAGLANRALDTQAAVQVHHGVKPSLGNHGVEAGVRHQVLGQLPDVALAVLHIALATSSYHLLYHGVTPVDSHNVPAARAKDLGQLRVAAADVQHPGPAPQARIGREHPGCEVGDVEDPIYIYIYIYI